MIPEIASQLLADVNTILENTVSYGIPPDQSGRVQFSDLAEAVIAMEKWCWITRSQLQEIVALDGGKYRLLDDLIAIATGEMFPTLPKYPMPEGAPQLLFLGASNATIRKLLVMEQSQRTNRIRVVDNPEVAAGIAIFHTDFGDGSAEMQPTIAAIAVSAASTAGVPVSKTPSLFYLLERIKPSFCSVFLGAEMAFDEATWKVRLNETLYLEHSDQSRLAAEYLFRLRPQPEVEQALIAHLQDHIAAVRRNIAQALAVPSFKSGFDLRLPLPTISSVLEPVNVQPETLTKVLELLKKERDPEVLHWLLCTLSAQFYGGKLKPFVPEVEGLTRDLDVNLAEEISDDTIRLRRALRTTERA